MIYEYSPLFIIILSLSFLTISIIFDIQSNKKLSALIALVMILSYAILFGLRDYSIGSDTKAYIDNFLNRNWDFELLFTLLTDALRFISINERIYLISITVLYGIFIYYSYYILGKNINEHIVIFIWCLLFSQSSIIGTINYFRQVLGFSFFLAGFSLYIKNLKFSTASIFIMTLSIFIHSSNALLILIVIISKYLNIRLIILILLLSLATFIFDVGGYISRNYNDYYIISRTISRHIYFNDRRSISTIYLNIIMYGFHLLVFLYLLKNKNIPVVHNKLYRAIKFYILVFALAIFMSFNREIAIRYYLLLPFLIPIIYMLSMKIEGINKIIKPFLVTITLVHLGYLLSRPWFIDQLSGNITP